jgi:hypothetical protein
VPTPLAGKALEGGHGLHRADAAPSIALLVPITERETKWRHEHGQEAFEQLLEDHAVTPEDPHRRSIV